MTPFALLTTIIGVLGLAIGSFLNVVIYRVPRRESILFPASHCVSCSTPIKARHNLPVVGWLMLHGRCATCQAPIGARYPLVEAGTSILMVAVTLHFGFTPELPAFLFLCPVAIALGMIGWDLRRLPDGIVLPAYVGAALLLMPAGAAQADWWPAARAVIGAAALATIYFTLALAYPGGATFGDVKLAGLLGLFLGWLSFGAVFVGALGGLLIGAVSGTARSARAGRDSTATVALGPCMVAAAGTAVFVTVPIIDWYGALVGAS